MKYRVKISGEYVADIHGFSKKAKKVEKAISNRALRRSGKNLHLVDCYEDNIFPPLFYKKRRGWLL